MDDKDDIGRRRAKTNQSMKSFNSVMFRVYCIGPGRLNIEQQRAKSTTWDT